MKATLRAIAYHLPERAMTSADLARELEDWAVEKIESKTGISSRHIAGEGECSSDLAEAAARKLFASGVVAAGEIDYILLCTQSPDYFLPTTACLLQERLGIPVTAGALDFNLGCSGFVYGLGLAQGLIETGQARRVLLLTAETYSKFLHPRDRSVRTIFGDAAAATLIEGKEADEALMGPYVYGTDGSGGPNLIVPAGGLRKARGPETAIASQDESGNWRSADNLFMNGAEIFTFTIRAVPEAVEQLLAKAGIGAADVDLYVFHQANRYMLEHLRKRMKIPAEKFVVSMAHCGNTVSSTIPVALQDTWRSGGIRQGQRIMLVGFGVGYSWGAALLRWDIPSPVEGN